MKKLLLLILFTFPLSAYSEPVETPLALFEASLIAKGYSLYPPAEEQEERIKKATRDAEQGDANAQYMLGSYYAYSDENKDVDTAIKWYEKAAIQGNAEAMFQLGILYDPRYGPKKNAKKSFYWSKRAAENGHTNAQMRTADKYEEGEGVTKNLTLSTMWMSKAADAGDDQAIYYLAGKYLLGEGVEKDYKEAVRLYKRAIEKNNVYAKSAIIKVLYENKDYAEAFRYARAYLGEPEDSMPMDWYYTYVVGEMYELGRGTRQNLREAKENYGISCDKGWQDGCDNYRRLNEKAF